MNLKKLIKIEGRLIGKNKKENPPHKKPFFERRLPTRIIKQLTHGIKKTMLFNGNKSRKKTLDDTLHFFTKTTGRRASFNRES